MPKVFIKLLWSKTPRSSYFSKLAPKINKKILLLKNRIMTRDSFTNYKLFDKLINKDNSKIIFNPKRDEYEFRHSTKNGGQGMTILTDECMKSLLDFLTKRN